MFQMQGGLRVMHWHGGNDWVPMEGVEHDAASLDPERAWLKGARIFRCSACEEQIAIAPEDPRGQGDADHPHPAI
jgi:hypothetical protein